MKIMIIGGGGREHALAWKAAQSPRVEQVFVAPGNAGTETEPGVTNAPLSPDDFDALAGFARDRHVDLTIVGPEAPLVAGIVDHFTASGLRCLGPSRAAAQLEGSKSFTKDFLRRHEIPTAEYAVFDDTKAALEYLKHQSMPIVVKADGLAAGKGVIIADSLARAETAVRDMLSGNRFGEAGHRVVIEEYMKGEEASFIAIVDGRTALPFATSQDHKPRDAGDTGPNTGGMGAYSPAPVVTREVHERIMREVIRPTVNGMAREGNRYVGFLYAGLMIDPDGNPKVVEYNCRFGDPEAQPIMMRLQTDLADLCEAAMDQRLDTVSLEFSRQAALGVVMTAGGYPGAYEKGAPIAGLEEAERTQDCKIFHAGTRRENGRIVTNGGRVLCVTSLGETVFQAQQKAYQAVERIQWQDVYYRTDIGYRAVEREHHGGKV